MPDGDKGLIVKLGALIDEARETVGELKDWSPVVREFAQDAFGPAVRESGLLAGDVVGIVRTPFTWFRLKCLGAILKQARKLVGDAEVQPLPTGYAVSMLDAMKDVDEPTLQGMWARLLASSLIDRRYARPRYVQLLSGMAPVDALVFEAVLAGAGLPEMPEEEAHAAVLNLSSLSLIHHSEESPDYTGQEVPLLSNVGYIADLFVFPSNFGQEFHRALTACEGDS